MKLKISNTGKFPLKYSIFNQPPNKTTIDPNAKKSNKKSSKPNKKSLKQITKASSM
jgi:hypothetical protein